MEIIKGENDFFTSVEKAMDEIDPKWRNHRGLLVLGSHSPSDVEEKIDAIRQYRERKVPVLGICLGMQLMAIEYARNELHMHTATSEEFANTLEPEQLYVIKKLPELRVGIRPVEWKGKRTMESHWHNYGFNNDYLGEFQKAWALSNTDGIVEIMNLRSAKFHVGVQFHPEYQSSKGKPHPLLANFIDVCRN